MNAVSFKQAEHPALPNLLIIGAMKAGTSSLHYYLSKHPQIFMSRKKELGFFARHMDRGVEWYKSNFDSRFKVNGESTPLYTRYPRAKGVPERVKDVLATPKFIYMVRDPIDRLLSHYVDVTARGWETRPFGQLLPEIEEASEDYLGASSYFMQLQHYLSLFPRHSIGVFLLERLSADRKSTLKAIFRFLEVDEDFWSPEFDQRMNVSDIKRPPAAWFDAVAPRFLRRQWVNPTWMPWKAVQAMRWITRIGSEQVKKPRLSREEELYLQGLLKPDVDALRAFLRDPLPEWRPYA